MATTEILDSTFPDEPPSAFVPSQAWCERPLQDEIFVPTREQLEDFLQTVAVMRTSGIALMTESDLCRLVRTGDPLEALRELYNRGVHRVVCLRDRSIASVIDGSECEFWVESRTRPSCRLDEFQTLLLNERVQGRPWREAVSHASGDLANHSVGQAKEHDHDWLTVFVVTIAIAVVMALILTR
jgi:hypothetical protein